MTKDVYDQRSSAMRQAEAALALDHAAIEGAKLNLGYTEIRAPFAGRLGRNQAAKGALVGPVTGALNTLVELDPIYVLRSARANPNSPRSRKQARRRQDGGGDFFARRPGFASQGRTDLSRQRG